MTLGVEFRESSARLPSVAFVAVGSVLVGSEQAVTSGWLGRGYDTELYLSVVVATLNGIAGGVAGARLGIDLWRRRGTMPARSTREPLATLWPPLAAGLLWLCTGTAAVSALALGRTALLNPSMEVSPLLLVLFSLVPCVWFALGLAASNAWSSRGAMVLMATLPYLLTMAVGQWGSATVLRLAPFIDERWDPGLVPDSVVLGAFVGRWLIWTGVALTAAWAAAPVAGSRPRVVRVTVLSGVAAMALTVALVTSGTVVGSELATPRQADELACTRSSSGSSVCLWPTQAAQELDWVRALEAFNVYRRELPRVEARFATMPPASRPDLIAIDASASLQGVAGLARAMDRAYVETLVRHCDPESTPWLVTFLHWVALDSSDRIIRPDLRAEWVDIYLREPVAARRPWLARLVASCGSP